MKIEKFVVSLAIQSYPHAPDDRRKTVPSPDTDTFSTGDTTVEQTMCNKKSCLQTDRSHKGSKTEPKHMVAPHVPAASELLFPSRGELFYCSDSDALL